MAGIIRKLYIVLLALFIFLAVFYAKNFRVDTEKEPGKAMYYLAEAELTDTVSADHAQNVVIPINGVSGENCHLLFHSIHSDVEVYLWGECIYSMKASRKNSFAKTPGCVWNDILLTEYMNGKTLRVVLTPAYPQINYGLPQFYIGAKKLIVMGQLLHFLPVLFFGSILLVVGLLLVAYVLYNRKNSEVDKNLGLLGLFAMQVAIWKISDTSFFKMLFYGYPIISLLPFMAMTLVTVPCLFFLRELHRSKERKIWYTAGWTSIVITYMVLFLQFYNLLDFRETLFLILLSIFFPAGCAAYMVIKEFREGGNNSKLKKNLLGFGLILLGALVDLAAYIRSSGIRTSSFAILGFLIYTISIGITILRESRALITAGKGVKTVENMVYHDKLTGLFNRAAFIMDTDPYAVNNVADYTVVVLDLNNLKKCNDTFGHERGDAYIKESAEIIQQTFGTVGNCYRMGGDEFYCLIPTGGLALCREMKVEMEEMIAAYNKASKDIQMGIACGFVRYDARVDYDLNATAKRADKLMYQNKEETKKAQRAAK